MENKESKVNMDELKKVIEGMITNHKANPAYNQAAADLISKGVTDKNEARNGYQTILTPASALMKATPSELGNAARKTL